MSWHCVLVFFSYYLVKCSFFLYFVLPDWWIKLCVNIKLFIKQHGFVFAHNVPGCVSGWGRGRAAHTSTALTTQKTPVKCYYYSHFVSRELFWFRVQQHPVWYNWLQLLRSLSYQFRWLSCLRQLVHFSVSYVYVGLSVCLFVYLCLSLLPVFIAELWVVCISL